MKLRVRSARRGRSAGRKLFLRLAGPDQIRAVAVVGDREFIGEEWLAFLAARREIPFAVRLRRRRRLALGSPAGPALPAEMFFRALQPGRRRLLSRCYVGAVAAEVVGKRLAEDEYLIVATTLQPEEALLLYRAIAGRSRRSLRS